jgi:hypothetical protein
LDALTSAVRGATQGASAALVTSVCPYLALNAFREEDAAFFVGREAFVLRLVHAAKTRNLIGLVGASGSGKTSIVQAGLVPALRRQRSPHEVWESVIFRPGDSPFNRLAAVIIPLLEPSLSETDRLLEARKLGAGLQSGAVRLKGVLDRLLEKLNGPTRLLLIADQFEELLFISPPDQRYDFAQSLVGAANERTVVLLVVRSDFYGHVISLNRELSDRLGDGITNLGSMTKQELERVILEPASRVGLSLEAGLLQRILGDITAEPGSLPLLEFALAEMWSRRDKSVLTNSGYDDIGELGGALATTAEAEFINLSPERQELAQRLFKRLVRASESGSDTRQPAHLDDLDPKTQDVARRLAAVRLIVIGRDELTGRSSVELSHEALIRAWSRLQNWLKEDREFLLWRQHLQMAIFNWLRFSQDDGALLRGALLAEAERWRQGRAAELSTEEVKFVDFSRNYRDREEQRLKDLYAEAERTAGVMISEERGRPESRRDADPGSMLRLVRIIVASPGDVMSERDAIRSIIDELNRGIGREMGIVLQIARWETDTHPGLHVQGPQGLIDTLLRIEESDLLIGVFWKRFGTPVGDSASGTEHEFRLARESWKKNGRPDIMAYFNEKAYSPRSKEDVEQWGRVLEFKQTFSRQGLWWAYKGKTDFERLVRNHLVQWLRSKFGRGPELKLEH